MLDLEELRELVYFSRILLNPVHPGRRRALVQKDPKTLERRLTPTSQCLDRAIRAVFDKPRHTEFVRFPAGVVAEANTLDAPEHTEAACSHLFAPEASDSAAREAFCAALPVSQKPAAKRITNTIISQPR